MPPWAWLLVGFAAGVLALGLSLWVWLIVSNLRGHWWG
jgi:hypothetical protein